MTVGTIEQTTLQTVNLGDYFQIGPAGLLVTGNPSFDSFDALGETLRTLDKSLQFAIGDFFREVEDRFGEKSSQILDHTGWSESTLRAYRWTAVKVPQEVRRMDRLTYSHHQAVAKLAPRQQRKWLNEAAEAEQPWSVTRLKKAIRDGADPEVTAWLVTAFCSSEKQRDVLSKELESRGIRCKVAERRGESTN